MMLILSVEPQDRQPALDVIASAFGRDDEARLVERLWAADAIDFEIVAAEGELVVGYCACSKVSVTPEVEYEVLGLAPLAVAPAKQKQGAGASLVHRMLAGVRKAGVGAVVLVGSKDYYWRFGFAPAARKGLRWAAGDGDSFQLIEFAPVFDGAPRTIGFHEAFAGSEKNSP